LAKRDSRTRRSGESPLRNGPTSCIVQEDPHALPRITRLAYEIACKGGTSFRGANHSQATFEGAHLRCYDFRGALVEGTRFEPAELQLCLFDGEAPVVAPRPKSWRLAALRLWRRSPA
jgi:hypothetical protein